MPPNGSNTTFVHSSKSALILYQKPLKDSKPLAVLNQVLKANPKNLISILKSITSADECAVLKRMNGKQEYFSKKLNTIVTLREWNNISPLEAAAHCLDNFIVNELLNYVPNTKKALEEAIAQLQGVLDSQELETDFNDNPKAIDSKSSAERRYLAPYKHLLKAYKAFNDNWDLTLMDTLWVQVWEAQRKLPTYGLQEFCNEKPSAPLPAFAQSFKEEPPRTSRLHGNSNLDLDVIGKRALYKGTYNSPSRPLLAVERWVADKAAADSAAFDRLCQVRTQELENIIKSLSIRLQKVIEVEPLSSGDSAEVPKKRHQHS